MQLNPIRRSSARLMLIVVGASLQLGLLGIASAQGNAAMELTLSQAIDLALKQNRTLKMAQLGVADSEQKKKIARADYFPHISNQSTAFRITELQQLVVPEGALGVYGTSGPIPAKTAVIFQGGLTGYTSGTGLSQPLTQMFKTHEESRAATADINSAKIQVNQAEDDLALKVRQLYYGILIAQLKREAAKQEQDAAQVTFQENTSSVQQGSAMETVALESHAALLGAKQTVLTQNLQIRDLTFELNYLLGLPLTTQLQLREEPSIAGASIPARDECVRPHASRAPKYGQPSRQSKKPRRDWRQRKTHISRIWAYLPDIAIRAGSRSSCTISAPLESYSPTTFSTADAATQRSTIRAQCFPKRNSVSPMWRTRSQSRLRPPMTRLNRCKAWWQWQRKS